MSSSIADVTSDFSKRIINPPGPVGAVCNRAGLEKEDLEIKNLGNPRICLKLNFAHPCKIGWTMNEDNKADADVPKQVKWRFTHVLSPCSKFSVFSDQCVADGRSLLQEKPTPQSES